MAGLEFKFDPKEFQIFANIRKKFPDLRRQSMGFVGARGKETLYNKFLKGQELTFHDGSDAYQKSKAGQRKISYKVFRWGQGVRIYSFPLNLFEKATYGGGRKIGGGKRIITDKFKSVMQSDLNKVLKEFDEDVLATLLMDDSYLNL